MQAAEFQDTAERLSRGQTEGDWRSAVSRAYYAIFHYFRELFLSFGVDVGKSAKAHFSIYVGLHSCGIPSAAGFGTKIDTLREKRIWADYDFKLPLIQQAASHQVQNARQIVADFQNLLATIPAAQIVAGVRKHLRSMSRIP